MLHTGFFTHRACNAHEMGSWHPESPERLAAIHDHLISTGIAPHLEHYDAPVASEEALARAHDAEYIDRLKTSVPQQGLLARRPRHLDESAHLGRRPAFRRRGDRGD